MAAELDALVVSPGTLTLADLRRFAAAPVGVRLDDGAPARMAAGVDALGARIASGEALYGVNTGFGALARTRIAPAQIPTLQTRLVLSHCAGTGPLLGDPAVRLAMLLKIAALAQGYSGARQVVADRLIALLEAGITPCVPGKGSVGASGDLAPLAHISAVLIGEGRVRIEGREMPASEGLEQAGITPITLAAKEGLALLNGTQVSTALALCGLFAIEDVFSAALVAGAMSVDAALGSDTPFDPRIQAVRGQPGQADVAKALLGLLKDSEIRRSHVDCDRVQDPYSLRCQPQVMGACLDLMRSASQMLLREANGVTDNPLLFADNGDLLSGGNFHAQPVAFAADILALAAAEIGALSERRIALLIDSRFSSLPPFLTRESGLNSGFMIPQVTAAALVAENRLLASPASVDSLPTSANQEDHVSMATHAARRLSDMADNAATIVGIELLAAAQGLDLRLPFASSPPLADAHRAIRAVVPMLEDDREAAPDIAAASGLVRAGFARTRLPADLLPSGIST